MKIFQLLPTISFGDAVGNDTLALESVIRSMGYETSIFAENIDQRLKKGTAQPFSSMPSLSDKDILIYHGSTGTKLNELLPGLGGRKMMIYHNITPAHFFQPYSDAAANLTGQGLQQFERLAGALDYCIADSAFNKQDLERMGYHCPIDVCPIVIPFADYEKKPNEQLLRRYEKDGVTTWLFTGRIAPNKKQEDVIRAFYYYHNYFNARSRLVFVGSWLGMEKCYERLCDYVALLELTDSVIFTGHIKFDEILAYYTMADVFVCMSEHEGFCVPLVEAMFFGLPIVAYDSCAVPETLGEGGLLLKDKDPKQAAAAIDALLNDKEALASMKARQQTRLSALSYESVKERFASLLTGFINGG